MENKQSGRKRVPISDNERRDRAKNYLLGYRFCMDMLHLRRYERRRVQPLDAPDDRDELQRCNELFWHTRMFEIRELIDSMKNGREKLILYYRYICGESVEQIADHLDISRRSAYRWHEKGLLLLSFLMEKSRIIKK